MIKDPCHGLIIGEIVLHTLACHIPLGFIRLYLAEQYLNFSVEKYSFAF